MTDLPTETKDSDVPGNAPPRRSRWPFVIVALIGLAIGFLGGASVASYVIVTQVVHMLKHPEEAPAKITARLDTRLDLSPEQEVAIEKVLRNRFKHAQQAAHTAWPIFEQILDQLGEDIRFELNDSQKKEWDELYPTIRKQWFKRPPDPKDNSIWE